MPLTDLARIEAEARSPRIVRLWWALQRLKTPVSFMNTGAHPDDETSGMLAALALRDGIDISCACATRGEGGQNDIGTEASEALGELRTAEMERAAEVLGLRLYWLSDGPDDTIFDFGFSKSGEETLAKWGRDRVLRRFVEIVRTERPDILCPTFLDVPGQHGHHRAMTQMAHEVFEAAADHAFPCDLAPWAPAKLYLPAWSGAGTSYDDDLPPPPTTLLVEGGGEDPVTGWSYARIGQQSRAFHRTQGMGRWIPAGEERDYPLHLAASRTNVPDEALLSGLAASLADLDVAEIAKPLAEAQLEIDAARIAFPDAAAVLRHAVAALQAIRTALGGCPTAARGAVRHRLARKDEQLSEVIRIAAGVDVRGRLSRDSLHPGDRAGLEIETRAGVADAVRVEPDLPPGWRLSDGEVTLAPDAAPTGPYPATHLPSAPRVPALVLTVDAGEVTSRTRVPLESSPPVLPARSATVAPRSAVINRLAERRHIDVSVDDAFPAGAAAALALPEAWSAEPTAAGFRVVAPSDPAPGLVKLSLTLGGEPAESVRRISYGHIAPRALSRPAEIAVRILDAALPAARIGYIGGGQDRVGRWLAAMGLEVSELTDGEIGSDAGLRAYDSIVVGIFAVRFRAGLAEAMPRLHRWVAAGGTLVTLYHRPWDGWDPDRIPPLRLEIGQPSLRWRVTDAAAEVEYLAPDHPLLATPNRIGAEDWAGWHKERGLYFAKSWNAAYVPLLRMGDPGESLDGALLAADIGKGRHVHTSLVLHHQMEKLVPGAFRLMANLVAPRA